MDCAVAREALSARADGEREPVPAARDDEHVAGCRACLEWSQVLRQQARVLHTLSGQAGAGDSGVDATPDTSGTGRRAAARFALGVTGVVQLCLAVIQVVGVDFGLTSPHAGVAGGTHLLNESTAWSAALGVALIAAAVAPQFAPGAGLVCAGYAAALMFYVAADWMAGQVSAARVLSHLPVVAGAALAALVWRTRRTDSASGEPTPAAVPRLGDVQRPHGS